MSPAKGIGSQRPVCLRKLRPYSPPPSGEKTGAGPVFVGVDVQMASLGTDADMFVVSKGVSSVTQLLGLLVGRFAHRGALAGFHTTSSGSFFELDARL